ncbi:MAG: tetratricopeptide repeat protein [Phycisphaerae bacterium]
MSLRISITIGLIFILWQPFAGGRAAATDAVRSETRTRRQILESALRRYDEAVAVRDQGSETVRRMFHQSLAGFESLIQEDVRNGYLYYNAANARMRLGEIGRAIADYRRALRLLPNNADVRRNLSFARSLCEVRIEPTAGAAITETLFFWHFQTSPRVRTGVALSAYCVFWLFLFFRLLSRKRIVVVNGLIWIGVVVSLAAGASVAWDAYAARYRAEAVTIADTVELRKGNGEGYQPQLDRPLPQGVEVRILELREDIDANQWYHVELRDGKDGWLRAEQAEVI